MKHAKSFDKLKPDELQALCRKAGIASGSSRRKKRQMINEEKIRQRARREITREEILALRFAAQKMLIEKELLLKEMKKGLKD